MIIKPFDPEDEDAVIKLWEHTGLTRAWNDPRKDIARKAYIQPELFLVGIVESSIVATVMAGYDGHRGWINYLAVAPDHQGKGYGHTMMNNVEQILLKMGCPKINLQIRHDNSAAIAFYNAIGFTQDKAHSMGKRIIPDE